MQCAQHTHQYHTIMCDCCITAMAHDMNSSISPHTIFTSITTYTRQINSSIKLYWLIAHKQIAYQHMCAIMHMFGDMSTTVVMGPHWCALPRTIHTSQHVTTASHVWCVNTIVVTHIVLYMWCTRHTQSSAHRVLYTHHIPHCDCSTHKAIYTSYWSWTMRDNHSMWARRPSLQSHANNSLWTQRSSVISCVGHQFDIEIHTRSWYVNTTVISTHSYVCWSQLLSVQFAVVNTHCKWGCFVHVCTSTVCEHIVPSQCTAIDSKQCVGKTVVSHHTQLRTTLICNHNY